MKKSVNLNLLVVLTLALLLALACAKDDLPQPEPEANPNVVLDLTDYESGRPNVARHYLDDVLSYWAKSGFPALARLSRINESIGEDPFMNFTMVLSAFDEQAFLESLESKQLPAELTDVYNRYAAEMPVREALIYTIRDLTSEMDQYRFRAKDPAREEAVQALFLELLSNAFNRETLISFSPKEDKEYKNEIPPILDQQCASGMDYFASLVETPEPPAEDDNDTSNPIPWGEVKTVNWKTTHNGACAALAVGACAAKLGLVPDSVTCELWNDLSEDICATAEGGAYSSKIAKYFDENGYECSTAWDGWFESACEEAKAALDRGCDVNIVYVSADGTKAHREMVTGINVSDANDENCSVSTLSWGQGATVNYKGGKYSGKSDGRRYRQMGEPKSYLEGSGTARLIYYCKK